MEQRQNASIKFVNTVPPDSLPILGDSGSKHPFVFHVMAPYSLKEKFETTDTNVAVKGLTFRSKNPTQSATLMKSMIQGAGITTSEYNLYNNHVYSSHSIDNLKSFNILLRHIYHSRKVTIQSTKSIK